MKYGGKEERVCAGNKWTRRVLARSIKTQNQFDAIASNSAFEKAAGCSLFALIGTSYSVTLFKRSFLERCITLRVLSITIKSIREPDPRAKKKKEAAVYGTIGFRAATLIASIRGMSLRGNFAASSAAPVIDFVV